MKTIVEVKMQKISNNLAFMPEIFKDIKCDFEEYIISFKYENNYFVVNIESDKIVAEIEAIFWNLYKYLGFIVGYFPNIIEATFADEKMLANITEQYKTNDCYIYDNVHIIRKMSERQFKESFKKFLLIEQKASLQFAMFNISMMRSNAYPQIQIINLLQSLDGLYEVLFNKKARNDIIDYKLKTMFKKLNELDFDNIKNEKREELKNDMSKIAEINFIDKIYYFCRIVKYDIFQYEKGLEVDSKYNYFNLVSKFVNTRNQFSHSIKKNDILNGEESCVYMNKLIILYRLLVLEKINLTSILEEEIMLNNLTYWNDYVKNNLLK